jgi:hypothetical protein
MRLTRDEIYLITFIIAALVVGAAVKHYRDRERALRPAATPPPAAPVRRHVPQ